MAESVLLLCALYSCFTLQVEAIDISAASMSSQITQQTTSNLAQIGVELELDPDQYQMDLLEPANQQMYYAPTQQQPTIFYDENFVADDENSVARHLALNGGKTTALVDTFPSVGSDVLSEQQMPDDQIVLEGKTVGTTLLAAMQNQE